MKCYIKIIFATVFIFFCNFNSFSQQNITTSPAFMGPNALPVPEVKNGTLSNSINLKVAFDYHSSSGDKTSNLYTELYIPLHPDKVGLNISYIPFENYDMNEATVLQRGIETGDGSGTANGDIYVGTFIQILKSHKSIPDILLTLNFKTASGNNFDEARFTDAPGYFFDLSFGKDISLNSKIIPSLRFYGMAGFYAWHTNKRVYKQDDAFLYGLGLDVNFNKFDLKNTFGGYSGYIGNGDRPNVFRSAICTKFNSIVNYEIRFQQGIVDFEYSSFRIGCNIDLSFIKKIGKKHEAI